MPRLGEGTIDIEFAAPGSPSLKPILVRSGLVLGGLLVALLLTELSIRIFGLGPVFLEPLEIPGYRLSAQRSIGYEYRPNYRATDQPYDRSHTGIETNSHGFRDVEFEERKLDGVVRILVFGDSVTVGNGIRDPARVPLARDQVDRVSGVPRTPRVRAGDEARRPRGPRAWETASKW